MIRLATVFSGIGAIEQALKRMQVEHQIVFACDNSDVDILSKDVGMDVDAICSELGFLDNKIKEIFDNDEVQDLYKNQLLGMLNEANTEYQNLVSCIINTKLDKVTINNVLTSITESYDVKKNTLL